MRKISLTLVLLLFVFYSCSSTDNIIKNTEVEYLQSEDVTIIHDFVHHFQIQGKWNKINYEEEFKNKKRDYFLYFKHQQNILGIYTKPNETRSNYSDPKNYFKNSLSKEIEHLKEEGISFELKTTDNESYQIYTYKNLDNTKFYGLIGIKNKIIYYVSIYNNNLNEKEKETFLKDFFFTNNIYQCTLYPKN